MAKRVFLNNKQFVHIPICDEHPVNYRYIKVFDGEKLANEFHIGVAHSEKPTDFYVALYLGYYEKDTITLVCEDEVPEDFFDGFVQGKQPEDEKSLYPNLYNEPTRQQIHFSPKRGWLNDPNGLFWKDGKFNIYFQHNPFGSRNGGVNVSWGHAITEDCVHFREYPDVIMPYSSRCHVASGSSLVDENNRFGKGKGAIISAYTALQSIQYRGRPRITQNEGQMLLYSQDDGMTFTYFDKNPIISVPNGEEWRDPKILEINGKLVAIVYEPIDGIASTSVYTSKDGVDWECASSGEKFHECPDFFPLEVTETGEKLYVMYGGNSQYSIGTFENFKFNAIEQGHYLDYGGEGGNNEGIYAGQTFSNYPDTKARYHIAWLIDSAMRCFIADDYEFNRVGFNSSLSLICKLTLHKTSRGYRIFRTPNENLETLRRDYEEIELSATQILDTPAEYIFALDGEEPITFTISGYGFTYNPRSRTIRTTRNKEYVLCVDGTPTVRLFTDKRSLEFFINGETSLSYFATPESQPLEISGVAGIKAKKYKLASIWENSKGK